MGAISEASKDQLSANKPWQTWLIKGGLLAVAVVMIVIGAALLASERDAPFGGGRAPGTVVGFRSTGSLPPPEIRYRVGGQEYLCLAWGSMPGYRLGREVTIRYHPDRAGAGRPDTFSELWLLPLSLLGIGTLTGLGAAFGRIRVRV